jgi:hypothetical protein
MFHKSTKDDIINSDEGVLSDNNVVGYVTLILLKRLLNVTASAVFQTKTSWLCFSASTCI